MSNAEATVSNTHMPVHSLHLLLRARYAYAPFFFEGYPPPIKGGAGVLYNEMERDMFLDSCTPLKSEALAGRLLLKLGEQDRTTHLARLANGGTLSEWQLFAPENPWPGTWHTDKGDVLHVEVGPYELWMVGRRDGYHIGCQNPAEVNRRMYFRGAVIDENPHPLVVGDRLVKTLSTGRSTFLTIMGQSTVEERWIFDHDGSRSDRWEGSYIENGGALEIAFGPYLSTLVRDPSTGAWLGEELQPNGDGHVDVFVARVSTPEGNWGSSLTATGETP